MKIAKGAFSWIFNALIAAVIFLVLYLVFLKMDLSIIFLFVSMVLFLKVIFFLVFFRDPDRKIGPDITACADGKIREITESKDNDLGNCTKISTFMNLYNVHVNRMPISGTVEHINHKPGSHLPAFRKESERNERLEIIINTNIGKIKIIQIAGTIARRIVPYVKKGDELKKGERIGIIRFGSRVDIYLPVKKIKSLVVNVGNITKAGETTLAKIND